MQRHQPKRTFLKYLPKITLRVQKKKKKKKKEQAEEDFTIEVESNGEEKNVIVID